LAYTALDGLCAVFLSNYWLIVTRWKSNVSTADVSQGSVVTWLRCGGKYSQGIVAYLL